MTAQFKLRSEFEPKGDQPQAIEHLIQGLKDDKRFQTLVGITGSGKTFTLANVIEYYQKPTLIMAPNKTLAAQLYGEMKDLFPDNAVSYFVSYYDYYQPEAYLPTSDTFIEKDAIVNDTIDRMRHSATHALLSRPDVIIVASVSCIYGIGSAESYHGLVVEIEVGADLPRDQLLRRLVDIQYERNDIDFHRGTFRVRGDVVEIFPVYEDSVAIRVEYFGDDIDAIRVVDPLRGRVIDSIKRYSVFPGSHYVTPKQKLTKATETIRLELIERLAWYDKQGRFVEKQRVEQRTLYDLEMMEQMGFVQGIENYSRHLAQRAPGEPATTLIDYFPDDFLLIVDESHQTIPQIGSMYKGDRSRKETLIDYGFRLPSAIDNRPLRFEEFESHIKHAILVSATPGDYDLEKCQGPPVQQIIRPTGLMDPEISIHPVDGQVDHLLGEIRDRVADGDRVLVTTLTKRMAEDLTEYYTELGVRVRYLHSDVETLDRIELLRDLRSGHFDVLVGINLLREGLDLPEVSLVAILDADKEGFLRSARSLIQTSGRAARNARGHVNMYADRITKSMQLCLDETKRRRKIQAAYNEKHGITPSTIQRAVLDINPNSGQTDYYAVGKSASGPTDKKSKKNETPAKKASRSKKQDKPVKESAAPSAATADQIDQIRQEMFLAAEGLEFERAARLRDDLRKLTEGIPSSASRESAAPARTKKKKRTKRS
ncbi:MAG: excinuclease ABC subunit UvrB [Polyangiaceae bacterium]|nr:excinuclease ABC subunit UvrB [Polyangiaceae bacterium]